MRRRNTHECSFDESYSLYCSPALTHIFNTGLGQVVLPKLKVLKIYLFDYDIRNEKYIDDRWFKIGQKLDLIEFHFTGTCTILPEKRAEALQDLVENLM